MKYDHNVFAVLIAGLTSGEFRMPKQITSDNRLHTERARPGSREEAERISVARLKRQRRAARNICAG
jgi:hypothetical protein